MLKQIVATVLCSVLILCAVEFSIAQDKGNIVFLTHKDWRYYPSTATQPDSGGYADSMYVADLRNAGYNVEVPNYEDFKTLGPEQLSKLNFADLVILGRGVSSGDFNDDDDYLWAELRTPILLMSNFTARANRLGWFRTTSQKNIPQIDTCYARVEVPDDPVFSDLNIPADNIIPYTEDVIYPLVAHKDSVGINGEVVLSLEGVGTGYNIDLDVGLVRDTIDIAELDDFILMARWEPGRLMYEGEFGGYKSVVPAGYRSYITVGGETFDYDANRQARKYYALTDIMNQVFLREVERLLLMPVPPPKMKKNILFLTHKDWRYYPATATQPDSGQYADSMYVADLRKAGYNVEVPSYEDFKTLGPEQVAALNFADLIILGRGVSSGDFNDDDDHIWAELTKPILLMSNFTARANRLGWFRTTSQKNIPQIDTCYAKVEVPNDPIFSGLDIPADNVIPYTKDVIYPLVAHKDSVGINGEVILSLEGTGTGYNIDLDVGLVRDTIDMAELDDFILMARWAPGDSMFTGLIDGYAAAMPVGYRSYITVGGETFDYDANRQVRKYYALTDIMNQVFLREVERLLVLPVPAPPVKKRILFLTHKDWRYYPATATQSDSGQYADSMYVADLIDAGYDVIVPKYDNYKTLGQAQIDTLIDVDLIILGRGVSSGDFNDDDDYVWEQLGTPIMLMSNFTARANRLGWFRTTSQKNIPQIDTCYAKVEVPNDPIFSGLDIPADNVIPYTEDVVYPLVAHKDSVGINGEIILSLEGAGTGYNIDLDVGLVRDTIDMAELDDFILMARWVPGDSMFTGLIDGYAAAMPAGYRSYITVGGETFDYDANRQARKYYALTDFMKKAWLNEVARMVHLWLPSDISFVDVEESMSIPRQYCLMQNYPNPFNPTTSIGFTLAKPGQTSIKVYNIMGQKVATLVDNKLIAGNHRIIFEGKNLASGIYFYKIKSGGFTDVRKMMFMK
ncbi:MAG: T9SS type A sorting domain-containing protein [candidate division KSB1 bacterium]|jgi:hypothetical protein|nr:T9SS type A sorting domain-containing protein [candidate division KSB1 bacterium]